MLKITNDGKKLALDQRLINPFLPNDPDSKVNVCVKNIFSIWDKTRDNRSTQLVFSDMSTPKNDGSFNVYDDIKDKLLNMGIQEKEIAFIHVARFHLDFEGIHPFIDGNGRTGRLVLNLELMKNGYPPISVKFTDRKNYYECFHEYTEKADPSKMILMVSEYIEEELDRHLLILE